MLRNIRPHSLGIVAAAVARPSSPQKSSQDSTFNVTSNSDNNSDRNASEQSLQTARTNGNFTSSESEKKRINQSQRTTTCEATCAIQDAENGFENGLTVSKFEVSAIIAQSMV